jgi:sugar O-acyltransferase (sialic acid O-acetyltransferase NeuD family)
MILFGVRSPIAVEYQETCARAGRVISLAVSVSGNSRLFGTIPTVPLDSFSHGARDTFLACAFSPDRRKELVDLAQSLGLELAEALFDPHAVIAASVRAGKGTFVNAGVVIGAVTVLGKAALINRSASIGHHCLIQDYVSIGPGATLAGNIHVGEGTVIGAGAVIQPNLRIGARSIIAAGSVVRAHVHAGVLVAGNPARQRPFRPKLSTLFPEDGE